MPGRRSFVSSIGARRLTRHIRSQFSGSLVTNGSTIDTPALWTRMSTGPVRAQNASMDAGSARSTGRCVARALAPLGPPGTGAAEESVPGDTGNASAGAAEEDVPGDVGNMSVRAAAVLAAAGSSMSATMTWAPSEARSEQIAAPMAPPRR
nr:hypothetical protein GCM10020093_101860 [Planobispora longispora]